MAKKLNLNSKELLEKAVSLGIDVKSHLSSISEEEANKIERAMGKMGKEKSNEVKNEKKKEMASEQPVAGADSQCGYHYQAAKLHPPPKRRLHLLLRHLRGRKR